MPDNHLCSGYSWAMSSSRAATKPRSVISPEISRAGVTSKPKLAAGVSAGPINTVSGSPSFPCPVTNFTSFEDQFDRYVKVKGLTVDYIIGFIVFSKQSILLVIQHIF